MPRKPSLVPMQEIRFYIPKSVYDELYIITLDALNDKPHYGWFTKIGTVLFKQFIKDVKINGLPQYLKEL